MITTIFKKSTPINYILVAILMIVFFFLYQFNLKTVSFSTIQWLEKAGLLAVILGSVVVINFVTKKNGLSKDSSYTIFFYLLFVVFFPSVLNEPNLLLANFFVLLAMRRLISLQTLKSPKEKIFDASLWIFVATLFHFWSILFVFLVFMSIFFHVSRDYRNWVLPFIAFVAVFIIFALFAFIFDKMAIENLFHKITFNFNIDYFTNVYQNIAISLYVTIALFFIASLILTLSNRPLILNSSYKKLFAWIFIVTLVFAISPEKSNGLMIFSVAPLAIMATNHIEITQIKWQNEVVLFLVIICSFLGFFSQL